LGKEENSIEEQVSTGGLHRVRAKKKSDSPVALGKTLKYARRGWIGEMDRRRGFSAAKEALTISVIDEPKRVSARTGTEHKNGCHEKRDTRRTGPERERWGG